MSLDPGEALYLLGGSLLVAVGGVAAILRRNAITLAFAAFAIGLGLSYMTFPFSAGGAALPFMIRSLAGALLSAGIWSLFAIFPRPLARDDRAAAFIAIAMALGYIALDRYWLLREDPAHFVRVLDTTGAAATGFRILEILVNTGAHAAAFLFPLRTLRLGAEDGASARSFAYVSISLFLFGLVTLPTVRLAAAGEIPIGRAVGDMVKVVLLVGLWTLATRSPHARIARHVAVAGVAIAIGFLAFTGPVAEYAFPVTRFLGALLLGYAVMRGQIEGLDLKVRFAISKSTVAAAFVAVFFVASEGAQIAFGQGNEWVGLLGAGALVFALAPLQRAAERLAEKAVPVADAVPVPAVPPLGAETFRRTVRLVLASGRLNAEQEIELARVAHDLGLTAPEATRIRIETERAIRGAGGEAP